MNTKSLKQTVILFITLTASGVSMIVFGQQASAATVREVLPLIGSGMFSAALAFFLIQMISYQNR